MSTNPFSKYLLPAAAGGLLIFAVASTLRPPQGRAEPLVAPPSAPFANRVGGVGVVEPQSEMISIATEAAGVVREVLVAPGDEVTKGQPLFRLDDRAQSAALAEAEANLAAARAAAKAAVVAAEDERQRYQLFKSVTDARAVSVDEVARRKFAAERAEAALAQANAEVARAEAAVGVVRTRIDLLTVAAPIDGRIFSVDARPGEFAAAGAMATPLMTIGGGEALHVRVEIDETDIARVSARAPAVAYARGQAGGAGAPLTFVRFEPQATAKRTLTGGSERVDARVVEAIYALAPEAAVVVGQRVDVFIDAAPLAPALSAEAAS